MKVILLEKYKKLGQVGDVVEVKNGFARNFLIPEQKAVQATKQAVKEFEAKKAELIEQSKEKEKQANVLAEKIKNKIVPIIKQASDDGRLYGSVATSEISEGLNKETGENIERKQINIPSTIKSVGFYSIDIDLGEGVEVQVYANIARTETEAQETEKKFLSGEISLGSVTLGDKQAA